MIIAAGETAYGEYYGFPENSKPKCLYEHQGEVILEKSIKLLKKHGIKEIIVVTGYKEEQIKSFLKDKKIVAKLVSNPDHSQEGLIHSVIFGAREVPPEDNFLLILGDVVLSEDLLLSLLKCQSPICIRKHRHTYEFFAAKLSLDALGDMSHLAKWVIDEAPRWAGGKRVKTILSLGRWLCEHNATIVWGRYWELDTMEDLKMDWEKET